MSAPPALPKRTGALEASPPLPPSNTGFNTDHASTGPTQAPQRRSMVLPTPPSANGGPAKVGLPGMVKNSPNPPSASVSVVRDDMNVSTAPTPTEIQGRKPSQSVSVGAGPKKALPFPGLPKSGAQPKMQAPALPNYAAPPPPSQSSDGWSSTNPFGSQAGANTNSATFDAHNDFTGAPPSLPVRSTSPAIALAPHEAPMVAVPQAGGPKGGGAPKLPSRLPEAQAHDSPPLPSRQNRLSQGPPQLPGREAPRATTPGDAPSLPPSAHGAPALPPQTHSNGYGAPPALPSHASGGAGPPQLPNRTSQNFGSGGPPALPAHASPSPPLPNPPSSQYPVGYGTSHGPPPSIPARGSSDAPPALPPHSTTPPMYGQSAGGPPALPPSYHSAGTPPALPPANYHQPSSTGFAPPLPAHSTPHSSPAPSTYYSPPPQMGYHNGGAAPQLPPHSGGGPPQLPNRGASPQYGATPPPQPSYGQMNGAQGYGSPQNQADLRAQAEQRASEYGAQVQTKAQREAGAAAGRAAEDRDNQKAAGEAIAGQSDNRLVQGLARNSFVQKQAGKQASKAANDEKNQQRVGDAVVSGAKSGAQQGYSSASAPKSSSPSSSSGGRKLPSGF